MPVLHEGIRLAREAAGEALPMADMGAETPHRNKPN